MELLEIMEKCSNDYKYLQQKVDAENRMKGNLDLYDCPICKNKGYIVFINQDGYEAYQTCNCMQIRKNLRRIKASGLENQIKEMTFENYLQTDLSDDWQLRCKKAAINYAEQGVGWFYISGQNGSGKTHLCTAIAGKFLSHGKQVSYIRWREEIVKIKNLVCTDGYNLRLDNLKCVDVLYIDDFFKSGKRTNDSRSYQFGGKESASFTVPTNADINIAFDLLDYRYINNKPTIISSELFLDEISEIDEAIAGRIRQRSKPYTLLIKRDKSRDFRMK